jgi:ketosteroid isomerase-like protein
VDRVERGAERRAEQESGRQAPAEYLRAMPEDDGQMIAGAKDKRVEAMREAMEAFNRRDHEAFAARLSGDAEIVPVRAALEGTVYRGPDAAAQYCAAVEESWENLTWEVEEIRAGDGWALALGRIQGDGRGSGASIDARAGWVARFHDGLIATFHTYADRAEALAAVGLPEREARP